MRSSDTTEQTNVGDGVPGEQGVGSFGVPTPRLLRQREGQSKRRLVRSDCAGRRIPEREALRWLVEGVVAGRAASTGRAVVNAASSSSR